MNYTFPYLLLLNRFLVFRGIKLFAHVLLVSSIFNFNVSIAQQIKVKKTTKTDSTSIKISVDKLNDSISDSLILNNEKLSSKNNTKNNDSLQLDSTNYLPRTNSAIKSIVNYTAKDSIVYIDSLRTLDLYSDSRVFYEDLNNSSDRITIDLNRNTITSLGKIDSLGKLLGTPEFKQGANDYKAVKIIYNYVTKKGYLKEFKTKEGEGFVKGTNVKRDPENNFYIDGAYYTTCDAEHPHFYIGSKKIKVVPGKKLITGPAIFVIEGIKTPLILPFGIFPLKRGQQSGIIIPQYGIDALRGPNLRQGGYYFGLGDRIDLTLQGDIFTNFSWLAYIKSNYNYRYRFNGGVNIQFGDNKFGNPDDQSYREEQTYSIGWNHSMDYRARPFTTFGASVNFVSGNYFTQNAQRSATQFNSTSQSSISYSKGFKNGRINLSTSANIFQNLQTKELSGSIPNVAFTIGAFNPFKSNKKPTAEFWYEKINMSYSSSFSNSFNTNDTILFQQRDGNTWGKFIDTTFKYGISHTIPINTSFKLFKFYVLSVNANYNETWSPNTIRKEFKNNQIVTNQVSEFGRWFTFSTGASLSTKWYGMLTFKKGKIAAFRHVADPNFGFNYTPDFSEKMWGYYNEVKADSTGKLLKYSIFESSYGGSPGQGRQGNITFGLNNNFEMKVRTGKDTAIKENKIKLIESVSFNGSYNIFADSLNLSTIGINARTTLFKSLTVNTYATLDPYENVITDYGTFKQLNRVNKYYFDKDGTFGKITNANLNFSYGLSQQTFEGKKKRKETRKAENEKYGYDAYELPWSINFNYAIQYQANSFNDLSKTAYIQTLGFSGNVTVTKGWTFGYSSGYDFINQKIASLFIDLKRDLHCWQFTFSWSPIAPGGFSFFNFQINPKSGVLQELKYPKRKDYFDNRNY